MIVVETRVWSAGRSVACVCVCVCVRLLLACTAGEGGGGTEGAVAGLARGACESPAAAMVYTLPVTELISPPGEGT